MMRVEVIRRAADLATTHGVDVEEALRRWEQAGGQDGGAEAGAWLSVAFLFARHVRSPLAALA
jgi:hypothetical protein